jgi:hypothetical protein
MLDFQLLRIGKMLVLATAAFTKITALGPNPVRRRLQDPKEPGTGEAFLHLEYFSLNALAGRNEGYENHKVVQARYAFTAERGIGDQQGNLLADSGSHAIRVKSSRGGQKDFLLNPFELLLARGT